MSKPRILVLGGTGMLGSAICRALKEHVQVGEIICAGSDMVELTDYLDVRVLYAEVKPTTVFNCAGLVGGIQANMDNQAEFLTKNAAIASNAIDAAAAYNVPHYFYMSSSCVYPRGNAEPMPTSLIGTGELEPTNEGYALAKLMGTKLTTFMNSKGRDYRTFVPCNLYGPGDKFDERAHVMGALIRKASDAARAGKDIFEVWGSGDARRELMHVDAAADAIIYLSLKNDTPQITNIGLPGDTDISIRQLAWFVSQVAFTVLGAKVAPVFDPSKPEGVMRKKLDTSYLYSTPYRNSTSVFDGIHEMMENYRARTNP